MSIQVEPKHLRKLLPVVHLETGLHIFVIKYLMTYAFDRNNNRKFRAKSFKVDFSKMISN